VAVVSTGAAVEPPVQLGQAFHQLGPVFTGHWSEKLIALILEKHKEINVLRVDSPIMLEYLKLPYFDSQKPSLPQVRRSPVEHRHSGLRVYRHSSIQGLPDGIAQLLRIPGRNKSRRCDTLAIKESITHTGGVM
jgi:hypothetical protein